MKTDPETTQHGGQVVTDVIIEDGYPGTIMYPQYPQTVDTFDMEGGTIVLRAEWIRLQPGF